MTKTTVAYTEADASEEAGTELGRNIRAELDGESPDALILFSSSRHDYPELLNALDAACRPAILVGCSSAGEFINEFRGENSACAIAIRSDEMSFSSGLGQNLQGARTQAAKEIASTFRGVGTETSLFHTALLLTDALSGKTDELIEDLNLQTGASYRFFGGGAGDDARFERTHVFHGVEAFTDAAVALEILSRKPLGLGVHHGWQPASVPLRVTAAKGTRLISLNASPAVELFEEHARATDQKFDRADPLSFFLHNVIGIDSGSGFKLRVPLAVNEDGSITCAADIPEGCVVRIMQTTGVSAAEAAARATKDAVDQLQGRRPELALFFDCVATRLRLGEEFGLEIQALENELGPARYAGCNTYGQIARSDGQFSGFHNCTAVVCVIPE